LEERKEKIPSMNGSEKLLARRERLSIAIDVIKDRLKELKLKLIQYPEERGID